MMMKWMGACVLAGLISGLGSPAQAARIGVFGSHWDAGNAGDEMGYGALLRLDAGQGLFMDLRGSWYEFTRTLGNKSRTVRVIPLEVAMITPLTPAPDFVPYMGGGLGYYLADGDFDAGTGSSSLDIGNELAFFFLAGLDIRLSRSLRFFAEGKYVWARFDDVDGEDDIPQPDIKADGLSINVGLILRW